MADLQTTPTDASNAAVAANNLEQWLEDLAHRDGVRRQRARASLVTLGDVAAEPLAALLGHSKSQVRWEAAKALGVLAHPGTIDALIAALEDRHGDVRWLAARALVAIGRPAVAPLLRQLIERAESHCLCEGAHHVFHDMAGDPETKVLAAILKAIEGREPQVEVPAVAEAILCEWPEA